MNRPNHQDTVRLRASETETTAYQGLARAVREAPMPENQLLAHLPLRGRIEAFIARLSAGVDRYAPPRG